MTSHAEVRLIRRYALMVIGCVVAGVLSAALIVHRTPVRYESQADVFVAASQTGASGGVYDRARFAQERVKSYVPLATSSDVLAQVIRQLSLSTSPGELAKAVTAYGVPETVLVRISVREGTAQEAQRVANGVATALVTFATKLESSANGGSQVELRVIEPADLRNTPVSPRTRVDLLIGAFLGLVLGLGAARLRHRWISDAGMTVQPMPPPMAVPRAEEAEVVTEPRARRRAQWSGP